MNPNYTPTPNRSLPSSSQPSSSVPSSSQPQSSSQSKQSSIESPVARSKKRKVEQDEENSGESQEYQKTPESRVSEGIHCHLLSTLTPPSDLTETQVIHSGTRVEDE